MLKAKIEANLKSFIILKINANLGKWTIDDGVVIKSNIHLRKTILANGNIFLLCCCLMKFQPVNYASR